MARDANSRSVRRKQCQRRECETTVLASLAEGERSAGQAKLEWPCCAFRGENPGREPRQFRFGGKLARQRRVVERHRTAAASAVERFGEPAGAARDRLPCNALRRIAALVFAYAGKIGVAAAPCRECVRAARPLRQRRCRGLGLRISDSLQRKMYVGPAAPQSERT